MLVLPAAPAAALWRQVAAVTRVLLDLVEGGGDVGFRGGSGLEGAWLG